MKKPIIKEEWWDSKANERLYAYLIAFAMVVLDKPGRTGREAVRTMNKIKKLYEGGNVKAK